MKILHYIDEYIDDGGSSLFVKELALDNEKILTTSTNLKDERVIILRKNKDFLNEEDFFQKIENQHFNIILLHSLRFITPNILNGIKNKNIKVGFISHDYYSICERVVLINNRKMLCSGPYGKNCIYCYMDKYPFIPITRQIRDFLFPFLSLFMKRLNWYKNRNKFFDDIFLFIDKVIYPSRKSFEITKRFLNLNYKSIVLKNFQKDIFCRKRDKVETPIFAFIGRSVYHKGLQTILKSFKIIKDENIKLVLWGDIKVKIKDKRIKINGKFESEKIDQVLNSFDALIFPSIWPETSGRVMLEAAKCGKVIIASNLTPAKELLKDYKKLYIFENNDHIALKSVIEKIVNDWKKIDHEINYNRFDSVEKYREKLKEVFFDNKN